MMMNLTDGVENVQLANMAEPQTGCLHDYQLRPKDLVSLEGADLFLANGGGMEEFLSDVLDTYPELTVVYALDGLHEEDLLPGEEHAHDGHDHSHGEAETGAGNIHTESAGNAVETSGAGEAFQEEVDEAEGHFGELTSGVVNPHTWLDPSLYIETSCVDLLQEPQSKLTPATIELTEQTLESMTNGLYKDLWGENFGFNCRLASLALAGDDTACPQPTASRKAER